MYSSDFYIPPLIGEGMVLRFGKGTVLWGKDIPYRKVEVEFQSQFYSVFADEAGNWIVKLDELEAGGPYVLKIKGSKDYVVFEAYVGYVFLLSGQSNMELPLNRVLDLFEEEVRNINNPYIRQFAIAQEFDFTKKQEEIEGGSWKAATGENVMGFSAAGYFCAAELYEKYKMPIGLIYSAVGGSCIEAWLSKEVLLPMKHYTKTLEQFDKDPFGVKLRERDLKKEQLWYNKVENEDKGKKGGKWYHNAFEHEDWFECQMPANFRELGLEDFNGVLWLYHEFNLTKEEAMSSEILLRLGTIVDADETYVNGELVGQTAYYYPPRRYSLKKGILKEGENSITVRVISCNGKGRFISDMPYYLKMDHSTLDLSGKWYYKVGISIEEKKPDVVFLPSMPVGLYHTMIWPIRNYTISSVLFYQGESNVNRADNYGELFKEMIRLWRETFIQNRLSFVYVQLPNYIDPLLDDASAEEEFVIKWKRLQDIQEQMVEEIDNVAMISTKDIGQNNELHPQNKKDVGKRLADAFSKLVL